MSKQQQKKEVRERSRREERGGWRAKKHAVADAVAVAVAAAHGRFSALLCSALSRPQTPQAAPALFDAYEGE